MAGKLYSFPTQISGYFKKKNGLGNGLRKHRERGRESEDREAEAEEEKRNGETQSLYEAFFKS